jgi:hypothetical protein
MKHSTPLHAICNLIPPYLVAKLARKHGIDKQARSFSPWSHVVALLFAQLAHSLSLNDVVDTLRNHIGRLFQIRRATPPSQSGLSYATKNRSADMAEELFWGVLDYLQNRLPTFGLRHRYSALPHRFRRTIYAVDSSTIQLVAHCMDWAKHRRRKAAAKIHLTLDLNRFLPSVAIVKAANTHDSTEAKELCAHLQDGEIALFDKAYVHFEHLYHLADRGVQWVTRAKDNMTYRVIGQHAPAKGALLGDWIIELTTKKSREQYPQTLRLVTARVEMDGKVKQMEFITNNMEWAATSVCDLYRSRWGIEVFFKQIKQTLKLSSFLGYSENAIRWQVWTAMLTYVLLRFVGEMSRWSGSFRRLFTLIRGVLLSSRDLWWVIESCGTAPVRPPPEIGPNQPCLPGFNAFG